MKKIFVAIFVIAGFAFAQEIELILLNELHQPIRSNSDGSVVVGADIYGTGAFRWTAENGEEFLGAGEAWDVSETGLIVGTSTNTDGFSTAAIWDGMWEFIGNIPGGNNCDAFLSSAYCISGDGNTVGGMGWIDCHTQAFTWTGADGFFLPDQNPNQSAKLQAIADDGSLMGGWVNSSRHSAIWTPDGEMTLLGSMNPGSNGGEVTDISSDGTQVLGFGQSRYPNDTEGYIWTEEDGFYPLGVPQNEAMGNMSWANGFSDNGIVLGYYRYAGMTDNRACIRTPETEVFVDLQEWLIEQGLTEAADYNFITGTFVSKDGSLLGGLRSSGGFPAQWGGYLVRLPLQPDYTLGDVNMDDTINIMDIITLLNFIIGNTEPTELQSLAADLNSDGSLDILDIMGILNLILN